MILLGSFLSGLYLAECAIMFCMYLILKEKILLEKFSLYLCVHCVCTYYVYFVIEQYFEGKGFV